MNTAGHRTETWDRAAALEQLREETWDVVVVGGGVTGAGVARDAALRGLQVALVEAGDFAGGTSSRTTKFAHGGLRYLEMLNLDLVREALTERAVLLSIAPHLTRATPFLIPSYKGRSRPGWKLKLGLAMYDALAGRTRFGRHQMLDRDGALAREPLLSPADLRGAGVYWDARVRDARLVIETIADARRAGAVVSSYCAVRDLERSRAGWVGDVEDRRGFSSFTLQGRAWVNATGPWSDRLRRRVRPGSTRLLDPTKGVHIVVPRDKLPLRDPTALFASDDRLYFAVPEGRWTYIGTTDTRNGGNIDDFGASPADVMYLIGAACDALTCKLSHEDVVGAWAGWRPLVRAASSRDPSAISREEVIEQTASRFVTVTGGKLTTYRLMAEETVNRLAENVGWDLKPCETTRRPLVPARVGGEKPATGVDPADAARVRELFGPDADDVFVRWREDPTTAEPLGQGTRYTTAEVERAAREMVETLEDLVDRRLSVLPGGVPIAKEVLANVARAAAPVLGWDGARQAAEVAAFRTSEHRP
jgi:glycerol-3-phosphate dehydrogenase